MAPTVNMSNAIRDTERILGECIVRVGALSSTVTSGHRSGQEAADWSLAVKNMAAALHSLIGAQQTARRS